MKTLNTPKWRGRRRCLGITWKRYSPARSCFRKRNLKPPRGALRGGNRCISKDYLEKASAFDIGGKHLNGGYGGISPHHHFKGFLLN